MISCFNQQSCMWLCYTFCWPNDFCVTVPLFWKAEGKWRLVSYSYFIFLFLLNKVGDIFILWHHTKSKYKYIHLWNIKCFSLKYIFIQSFKQFLVFMTLNAWFKQEVFFYYEKTLRWFIIKTKLITWLLKLSTAWYIVNTSSETSICITFLKYSLCSKIMLKQILLFWNVRNEGGLSWTETFPVHNQFPETSYDQETI